MYLSIIPSSSFYHFFIICIICLGVSKTHFIHVVDQKLEQMTKKNSHFDQHTTSHLAPINNNGDDSSVSSAGLNNDNDASSTRKNKSIINNNSKNNNYNYNNSSNNPTSIGKTPVKLLKRPHTAVGINLQSNQVNEQLKESILKQKARNAKVRPSTGGIDLMMTMIMMMMMMIMMMMTNFNESFSLSFI